MTVTGPGGSGKTRLAGEVARRVAGRFADGAWVAELATVQNPAQVASVVAAALGVRELPGVATAEVLARVLAGREFLLVVDNREHGSARPRRVCRAADRARWRDDLGHQPETVPGGRGARYRLAPLALPDLDDLGGARGPRRWPCSPTGPAAPMRGSRWMRRSARRWRGW